MAEAASERGVEVVFADNEVRPVDDGDDLDAELRRLASEAVGEPVLS